MRKFAQLILMSLFLILYLPEAIALPVKNLYQATIAVKTQSAEERNQASEQALHQVIMKVTGSDQFMQNPMLLSKINSNCQKLIQQFSYRYSTPKQPTTSYLLNIQFDKKGVDQLLQAISLPIWGSNRPIILTWVTLETLSHSTTIVDSDAKSPLALLMQKNATRRGLPIIFPMMDKTDLENVSVTDMTTVSTTNLINAAKRYESDILLMGNIKEHPQGFTSQWKLLIDNEPFDWTISAKTLDEITAQLMDNTANHLATHFAILTTKTIQDNVSLKILGVNQQIDLLHLVHYLQQMPAVAEISIIRIEDNTLTLKVSLHSSQQSFTNALRLSQKLIPVADNPEPNQLNFQWNP